MATFDDFVGDQNFDIECFKKMYNSYCGPGMTTGMMMVIGFALLFCLCICCCISSMIGRYIYNNQQERIQQNKANGTVPTA